MDPLLFVRRYLKKSLETLRQIPDEELASVIALLEEARREKRTVFLCGNGGSASTASHMANDLGKGASLGKPQRFKVHSLVDNVAWMTALANDTDYSQIFVEQLKNFAGPKDLLITFSGSGNSANVLEAVRWAREQGLMTVGVTGRPGGRLASAAEKVLFVESNHMGRIEEAHFLIQHLLSYYFMEGEAAAAAD